MIYQKTLFNFLFRSAVFLCFSSIFLTDIYSQKIAVLTPEKTVQSSEIARLIENSLSTKFKVLDNSLSETAFNSAVYENPFNLTLKEAQNIGAAIGCDYFLLINSKTLRRFSFEKKEFFETYAAVYIVSSRSGRLIFWKLIKGESKDENESKTLLLNSVKDAASEISGAIIRAEETEINEKKIVLEELPEENSPEAKNFQPPLPYKRFRPNYTETANLYSIEATVDILLDVDENGKILRTEIARWAGFGLDESVQKTVTEMNWRAASRNGENLPIRVLLRYNFKKLDKD